MFEQSETAVNPTFVQFGSPSDSRYRGSSVQRLRAWIDHPDTGSVEQICAALGMNHARLARMSKRTFGETPKLLIRRARLLRMLAILEVRPYREWRAFLDWRYVDQSHFIRDFQHFLGMAPRDYSALPLTSRHALLDSQFGDYALKMAA